MNPHVALGVKLRRLLHAVHAIDLGQHMHQQARLVEQLESSARMAFRKHLRQFVANALAANLIDLWRQFLNRGEGTWLNDVPEARGEAHRAQHAQLVFAEAQLRLADGSHHALSEIFPPPDKIQHPVAAERIHQQAVDGEVAPLHVLLRTLGILHVIGMTAIRIDTVAAKGSYLNRVRMFGR